MSKVNIEQINDFDQLLAMVREDASLVDNLSEEQVSALRAKINVYGRTLEGSDNYTCLSITNLTEQYMKRFLMTSLIGFVYRRCDEYLLDDGEPPTPMDDFEKYSASMDVAFEQGRASMKWLNDNKSKIREYKNYQIDHEQELGKTSSEVFEMNKKKTLDQKEQEAQNKIKEQWISFRGVFMTHTKIVQRAEGFKKRLIVRKFLDEMFQFNPDKHVRSAYSYNPLDPERKIPKQVKTKSKRFIKGKSGKIIKLASREKKSKEDENKHTKHIPPFDTFFRWQYYMDTNYEEIRSAVRDLYCEKPDLEFAINPYNQFDNEGDAKKFVQKHKNEVIADILTLTNGKWNLTGSFKKNRDRINFYNEKTAVIEEIFKQIETDKKLGADLMRKRVKRKKAENIKETGVEPQEFKQYRKENPSAFEAMGAMDVGKTKDSAKEEITFAQHEECPYDAVEVGVYDFREGGQTVKTSQFFTQAEAPSRGD